MLYIFGGLPGTGKTALAQLLAREKKAVYLRIDTIEQALREAGVPAAGAEGYIAAYRVAEDNLRLGSFVVADSVNPLEVTRSAWRDTANRAGRPYIEIEVICSDLSEHRSRVEERTPDIDGFKLPSWEEVVNREYEPWDDEHLMLDTAGQKLEHSFSELLDRLKNR
jgi:predicted kinase